MSAALSPSRFAEAADVFWSPSGRRLAPKGSVRFRRFASLAEAVRFLMLDKSEPRFHCAIDTAEERYEGAQIDALYRHADFPSADASPACPPNRGFWSGLFSPASKPSLYEARHEAGESWAIVRLETGEPLVVNRRAMTGLGREEADRMLALLDAADGEDMLAVGP